MLFIIILVIILSSLTYRPRYYDPFYNPGFGLFGYRRRRPMGMMHRPMGFGPRPMGGMHRGPGPGSRMHRGPGPMSGHGRH